jgi:CYTH domain-containing protein
MNNFEKGSFIENKENFENKEIERKFLVESLPENIDDFEKKEIIQGYLAVAEDGTEVRLRKKGEKYFQTVKSGGGKVRSEFEVEITREQFDAF